MIKRYRFARALKKKKFTEHDGKSIPWRISFFHQRIGMPIDGASRITIGRRFPFHCYDSFFQLVRSEDSASRKFFPRLPRDLCWPKVCFGEYSFLPRLQDVRFVSLLCSIARISANAAPGRLGKLKDDTWRYVIRFEQICYSLRTLQFWYFNNRYVLTHRARIRMNATKAEGRMRDY